MGNLFVCDRCKQPQKHLYFFEVEVKIESKKHMDEHYIETYLGLPRYRSLSKRDLCYDCYKDFIKAINKSKVWSGVPTQ